MLAVDANGSLIDGDHILAVCALDRRDRGRLPGDTLVLPGHGLDTTIASESPHLDEWIARGW